MAAGPVDVLVNNAAIARASHVIKTDVRMWDEHLKVNLTGAFLTIRECLASMLQTDWGRVIGVASIAGVRGLKGGACYSASKHGLVGLIRSLSEEYLGTAFTFNAICPGYVDTPIVSRNIDSISARAGVSREAALAMMVDANRHRRLIAPEEIAAAAMWLVGPGSQSTNGQTVEIAGGQV